jgi:hypothetical protein
MAGFTCGPAVVARVPPTGLSREDADHIAALFNQLRIRLWLGSRGACWRRDLASDLKHAITANPNNHLALRLREDELVVGRRTVAPRCARLICSLKLHRLLHERAVR